MVFAVEDRPVPASTGTRPADVLHAKLQQAVEFAVVQHVRFAGRPGHDQRLGAAGELVIDQPAERSQIECTVAPRAA